VFVAGKEIKLPDTEAPTEAPTENPMGCSSAPPTTHFSLMGVVLLIAAMLL